MKTKLKLIALLIITLGITGCASCENTYKNFSSSTTGLERRITLYDCSGKVIRQWEGRVVYEDDGSMVGFTLDGKKIDLQGTIVIEER